jgi:hypothetical protein
MSIFETAASGARESGAGELNILIGDDGALRIVAGEGWRPEALSAHYGAKTVYQVKHTADGVRVEGRSGEASCVLQTGIHRPVEPYGGYNQHVCAAGSSCCLPPPR